MSLSLVLALIWLALANLKVEGPGIPKHSLASTDVMKRWRESGDSRRILEDIESSVKLIRGFAYHKGQKLTHTVSVGDPAGIHSSRSSFSSSQAERAT